MTSEWFFSIFIGVIGIIIFSEVIIFLLCITKAYLLHKYYRNLVNLFIENKSDNFKGVDAEIVGNLEYVEIYIKCW